MKIDELLEIIDEIYNFIDSDNTVLEKKQFIYQVKSSCDMNKEDSFSLMYHNVARNNRNFGRIYTPEEIANFMVLNLIDKNYIVNNPYLKILEPSCGCGNLIVACYKYIKRLFVENIDEINKKNNICLRIENIDSHIMKYNLFGFDIDNVALKILKIDLFILSGILDKDNFIKADFLKENINCKFNFILGNPPYIGHKSVDKVYSKYLKDKYRGIYKDKGDVCYCFLSKSIDFLNNRGRLCFIVPRYFCESSSGEKLRKLISENTRINKIVDFYGIRPFRNVGIDPVIICLEKISDVENLKNEVEIIRPKKIYKEGKSCRNLFFNNNRQCKKFLICQKNLKEDGWVFVDRCEIEILKKIKEKSRFILSDICDSHQGIITGCDKAFIVDNHTADLAGIERDVLKPWIKNSCIHKYRVIHGEKYIICLNNIRNKENYSNSIRFIKTYRKKLENRRECRNGIRKWYEIQWIRKPEIFEGEKIVYPYKADHNRFALDCGSYFSADIYCLTIKKNFDFSYDRLLYILNSTVYEFYFKTFAKKLGKNMYEYYPNKLMKLKIPYIPKNFVNKVDYLYNFFGFTKDEIKIIEEKCN